MDIPKLKTLDAPALDMPTHQPATFMLGKTIAKIRRGTTIIHYPATGTMGNVDGSLCNHTKTASSTVEWRSGSRHFGNWRNELGEVFFEVLSSKGYNVQGIPFRDQQITVAAEYVVGGRIEEIRGIICQNYSAWDGRPLREFSGELYVKVSWHVWSVVGWKEVLVVKTEGYDIQKESKSQATATLLTGAFENAVEALLEGQEFINIALRKSEQEETEYVSSGDAIELPMLRQRTKSLTKGLGGVLGAVVTVGNGAGHGSGFAISKGGYILTNAHVVGKAVRVPIILSHGLEIEGCVLGLNEHRDIALIKVAIRIPWALPIRRKVARRLKKVFVIGSPILESMQSTVTTGIVSALRRRLPSDLTFIQSDAAISGGNSGGPMLDEFGNVIGVAVSTSAHPRAQNLNNFIPINSALEALKITMMEKVGGR